MNKIGMFLGLSLVLMLVIWRFGMSPASKVAPDDRKVGKDSQQVEGGFEPALTKKQTAPDQQPLDAPLAGDSKNQSRPGSLQIGVKQADVTRKLELGTQENVPGYDKTSLEVKVGEVIELHFTNHSSEKLNHLHSFVLVKPKSEAQVSLAADRAGPQHNFLPESDDILAHTKLLKPQESDTILFRAPAEPGDYPYICVFPGHGEAVKGTLQVKSP